MLFTRLALLTAALASFGGCFPRPIVRLDVQIRRYEGQKLRTCDVATGWTPEETEANCGAPVARVDQVGMSTGPCMIFDNVSQAIRSDLRPAQWLAVCFEPAPAASVYVSGAKRQEVIPAGMALSSVIGLTQPPPGLVK